MNRRDFGRITTGVLGGALVARREGWTDQQRSPPVNGRRVNDRLRELSRFGRTPEGGVSRVAYSDADLAARDYVAGLMRGARLEVDVDIAGNLVGRRGGIDPDLAPLMMGSHIDSVPEGGNYDGQVGSMGAIEVASTIAEHGLSTRHPLEVIIFQNEEGGKTGSRALSGEVEARELDLETASGYSIGQGIARLGGDPARLDEARRSHGDVAGFLELHVEQGGVLYERGIQIGVVQGIVGITRWNVSFEGFANHAGTTPMAGRRDALLAGAKFIQAVNEIVRSTPGSQVGTVGRIAVRPGAPNVIPGHAILSLELRDLDMQKIERLFDDISAAGTEIAAQTNTEVSFDRFYVSRAAPTAPRFRATISRMARALGLTTLDMPSGAGHDAQSIAQFGPVGMIFVPSVNGISHSPRELTKEQDVTNGTNLLLTTLMELDRELD